MFFPFKLRFGNQINGDSRKGAKDAKFGEDSIVFSLRAWRLGAKIFVEVILLKIQLVRT